jgi:hypothetical protein
VVADMAKRDGCVFDLGYHGAPGVGRRCARDALSRISVYGCRLPRPVLHAQQRSVLMPWRRPRAWTSRTSDCHPSRTDQSL